jgi:glutathione-regulated potassium-efflux system ancillary protein KefF
MSVRAVVLHAHPYPDRSTTGRALLDAVRDLEEVEVRSLYELYPDFSIDVEAEQAALLRADVIVWHAPIYWYAVPAMLSLWFEKVLTHGWAFGEGATALKGKRTLWVTTTGGSERSYAPGALHARPFSDYVPPVEQTARFCGMRWEEPLVIHDAHRLREEQIHALGRRFRERLLSLTRPASATEASP